MAKLYFLDFEASSLNSGSFPIEVAWVGTGGHGESYLIKPEAQWNDWCVASASIHGISRKTLNQDGKPATMVAQRAWEALQGEVICSDNPDYDHHWLSILLAVNGLEAPQMVHLLSVLAFEEQRLLGLITHPKDTPAWHRQARILLDEGQTFAAQQIENESKRNRVRHRALPDAEGMWWCWNALKVWVDQRLL